MLRPVWRYCPGLERLSRVKTKHHHTFIPEFFCTSQRRNVSQSKATKSVPAHLLYPIRGLGPLAITDSRAEFNKRVSMITEDPATLTHELERYTGDSHPVLLAVDCPPDIRLQREQIFHVPHDLEYTPAEWNTIWPWVSNLWRLVMVVDYEDHLSGHFDCPMCKPSKRGQGPADARPRTPARRPDSNELCGMTIHVRFMYKDLHTKQVDRILVSRTRNGKAVQGHNHTLRDMDLFRRNVGVRWAVEVLKAQSYPAIVALRILQAKFNKRLQRHWLDAGGEAISRSERNFAGTIIRNKTRIAPYLMSGDDVVVDQVRKSLVGRTLRAKPKPQVKPREQEDK